MMQHRPNEGHTWTSSFYRRLAGDLGAATLSATLVTPAVTIIDRYIPKNEVVSGSNSAQSHR